MIRYPGHAFVGAVTGLAGAAGSSLWLIWSMDAWEAAAVGVVLGVCVVTPVVAVLQWRHDDRLADETRERINANWQAADGFAAARIESSRNSMEEYLRAARESDALAMQRERAEDAAVMLEAAKAMDRLMQRNHDLESRWRPFDSSLRVRKRGRFAKREHTLPHSENETGVL